MKPKIFFLVIMPLVWAVVSFLSTYHQLGDRLTLLAFVPSTWLLLFTDANSVSFSQALLAGAPAIAIVGLILLKLKMTPRAAIISALLLALTIWVMLLISCRDGHLIKVRGAVVVWFFICFNFSLCLLPPVALLGYIGRGLIKAFRKENRYEQSVEQGGPGYPPQGVGSPDP